jgi:predicted enzyme related to lactoylglutathione lyase
MTARHVLTILAVTDLERAKRFYAEAFGWSRSVEVPVYVEHELPGGMRLGLYERGGFAKNTGQLPVEAPAPAITATELYLHVDDPAAAAERLTAAGARLLSPLAERPWGDDAAYFADPDGNVLVVARPR